VRWSKKAGILSTIPNKRGKDSEYAKKVFRRGNFRAAEKEKKKGSSSLDTREKAHKPLKNEEKQKKQRRLKKREREYLSNERNQTKRYLEATTTKGKPPEEQKAILNETGKGKKERKKGLGTKKNERHLEERWVGFPTFLRMEQGGQQS